MCTAANRGLRWFSPKLAKLKLDQWSKAAYPNLRAASVEGSCWLMDLEVLNEKVMPVAGIPGKKNSLGVQTAYKLMGYAPLWDPSQFATPMHGRRLGRHAAHADILHPPQNFGTLSPQRAQEPGRLSALCTRRGAADNPGHLAGLFVPR